MNRILANGFILLLIVAAFASAARGAQVKMRLVRADAPDMNVSTAITKIDVEAERAAAQAEEQARAGAAKGGANVPKDIEIKPRAEFDRYCNYMRGILIDGKLPFHRTYKGSYLGRGDEITFTLDDGEHRIDPGNHRFVIANGQITTDDPTLGVKDGVLEITLFPVTIIAIDGSAVRDVPAEVLRLPVSPRLFCGEESLLPKEELIADNATFKRMTLYMIANSAGMGYRVAPSERNFHVTQQGITVLDETGKPATDKGVYVEGQYTLVLPKISVPVEIRGKGVSVNIAGPAGTFRGEARTEEPFEQTLYAFSARGGANVRFGNKGENGPFVLKGDFGAYPRRKLLFDAADPASAEPRLLSVSLPQGSVASGGKLQLRVEVCDAIDAATITPFEVKAFLYTKPVLRPDATLEDNPTESASLDNWLTLRMIATGERDVYEAELPKELKSNVYWLRVAADRRGFCTPRSPLQADFVQGVINPTARTIMSVFCPVGRHAYYQGADVPFSAVVKSTVPVDAASLQVVLSSGQGDFLLTERKLGQMQPGKHPFNYVLKGSASEALAPGEYFLSARLNGLESNRWKIKLIEPRDRNGIPYFDDGWLGPNIDAGVPYANVPENIAEANEKRTLLDENVSARARRGSNLQVIDWSSNSRHSSYQGRDSSSEVAQVEMLLRNENALPAHEVYYYQNHFESVNETLMRYGMDDITSTPCFISQLSLIHSLKDQVDAKMRQHQLIAEIGRKFENFIGINPMFMSTSPLGNSEIPDPTRHMKLINMTKNFEQAHGYKAPTFSDAIPFIQSILKGQQPKNPEAGERWEAWMLMINSLMADYYANLSRSVDPLFPGMLYTNRGPSWAETTEDGTYPGVANKNQNPLLVFTGHGDYCHWFIWYPTFATEVYGITGQELWGVCGSVAYPQYRHHLGMFLMSGAHGFGFLRGPKPEALDVTNPFWSDDVDELLQIRDWLRKYGPALRQVDHKAPVAVYYPFVQSMYDTATLQGKHSLLTAESAMMQLSVLGYSYEVMTDEMLQAGEAKRFKAVVAPLLYYLHPNQQKALEEYAAAGGTLLIGSESRVVPAGGVKIEDDFQELPYAAVFWDFNAIADVGHAWVGAQVRRKAPILKQALSEALEPFARPVGNEALLQTGTSGDVHYTYVVNFSYPSWVGTGRVTGDPERSALTGEANESTFMPCKPAIDFPAGYNVYDLFAGEKLQGTKTADGRTRVRCDLASSPFRVLVSVPAEIAKMRVSVPAQVTLGRSFPVGVELLDIEGKAISSASPIKVEAVDGTGKAADTAFGVTGKPAPRIGAGIGFASGTWKVSVTELLSGKSSQTTVTVAAPEKLPFGDAVAEVPKVATPRLALVKDFVRDRAKDEKPVLILLDEEQYEKRLPVAGAVQEALKKYGVRAEICKTNAPGVFAEGQRMNTFNGRFVEMDPQQYIDRHIVLIGGEGESVLIEELQNSELFDRPITASYPGQGRAVLTLVRSAFAYQKDALCLLGSDNDALLAAAAMLAALPADIAVQQTEARFEMVSRDTDVQAAAKDFRSDERGNPIIEIAQSPDGRIAFGTSGFARNTFVFDADGKPLVEDQVGHIHATDITLLPDGRLAVKADGNTYLRNADGTLAWQVHGQAIVDSRGRYVVKANKDYFHVYDLNLKELWGFDEWDQYETTKEILFGRKATVLGTGDSGDTIIYRLAGKAPGAAGVEMDAFIFADALTGKEKQRVDFDLAAVMRAAGFDSRLKVKSLQPVYNGEYFLMEFKPAKNGTSVPVILLDKNLKIIAKEQCSVRPYFGQLPVEINRRVIWDHREVFTVGDAIYLTNSDWTSAIHDVTSHQILGLAVDEQHKRLAVSNYAGEVILYDANLSRIWQHKIETAGRLAFMPDGRLIVGTVRGDALALAADGSGELWRQSLRRYAEPAEVEERWAQVEKTPRIRVAGGEPWWERLQKNVPLGDDLAELSGTVKSGQPLEKTIPSTRFGTYLVTWRHGKATGGASLSLRIVEVEKPLANGIANEVQRVSLAATPVEAESAEYAILHLGDRPENVKIAVQCGEQGQAFSSVSVRPIDFPSENYIRMDALYRGGNSDEIYVDPPVKIDMFFNVDQKIDPFVARHAEPTALVNGIMLQPEEGLKEGRWWGSGTTAKKNLDMIIPSYVEIVLPRKRVITHVAIAEDPTLDRGEVYTVDAWVESREVRQNVTEFERRQLNRGFWFNVVKFRGNNSPYNVLKFKDPVYTNKLRVYVLGGSTSVSEIELYGGLSKQEK